MSFFSVECAGQAGKGGSECNFTVSGAWVCLECTCVDEWLV